MTAPSLYLDDDTSDSVFVATLQLRGYRVLTATEAGMRGRSDSAQLMFASQQGFVLLSYNRGDFAALHGEWRSRSIDHAGILLLFQQRFDVKLELAMLRSFVERENAESMRNQLQYITAYRT